MYKKYFEAKKAVFFDLDGTIVDSIPLWRNSFMKILEGYGYIKEAQDHYVDGGSYVSDIWRYIKKYPGVNIDLSVKELTQKTYQIYLDLFDKAELEPRDGFWEFIAELKEKNFKLALVTNSDAEIVDPVTTRLDIKDDIFDLVVTGDQVRRRKPSPDGYNKALKDLKLKPNEVLCFEDSVSGSKSAKRAKLDTVAIWDGQIIETDYPRNVLTFLPDFSSFPGNLETTRIEHTKQGIEYLEQETP